MEDGGIALNEYYSDADRKRLASVLMLSRAESGLSQERVALELGIAKKTVQNWERGVSAPTLPQAIEWFRVLDVAPMPYFLRFMFPGLEVVDQNADDRNMRIELIKLIETLPGEGVKQLMFLFYGNHGSSPRGILNMLTAHLKTPMADRYRNARSILDDYKLAVRKGEVVGLNEVQPNLELLENAIDQGKRAVLNNKNHYMLME